MPTAFLIHAEEENLPPGWIALSNDYFTVVGTPEEFLEALKLIPNDAEYASGLGDFEQSFADLDLWPAGSATVVHRAPNPVNPELPLCLVKVSTAAGTRWVQCPFDETHEDGRRSINDAIRGRLLAKSADDALNDKRILNE